MAVATGIPELDRKLKTLGDAGSRRVARSALGKGMTVIAKRIRAEVPESATKGHGTKNIKASIGKRYAKNRRTGVMQARVGIDVGKKRAQQKPQAHLRALGTVERKRTRIGGFLAGRGKPRSLRTGLVKGVDFVGAGYRASSGEALAVMTQAAEVAIQKEATRNG